ncbi:hypothetical protein GQX74_001986 [Glossina fuscipes]|nr:hypothetical protein GQX74_001986 [Glossina fuscipes]
MRSFLKEGCFLIVLIDYNPIIMIVSKKTHKSINLNSNYIEILITYNCYGLLKVKNFSFILMETCAVKQFYGFKENESVLRVGIRDKNAVATVYFSCHLLTYISLVVQTLSCLVYLLILLHCEYELQSQVRCVCSYTASSSSISSSGGKHIGFTSPVMRGY